RAQVPRGTGETRHAGHPAEGWRRGHVGETTATITSRQSNRERTAVAISARSWSHPDFGTTERLLDPLIVTLRSDRSAAEACADCGRPRHWCDESDPVMAVCARRPDTEVDQALRPAAGADGRCGSHVR